MQARGSKSNEQVLPIPSSYYAHWRVRCGVAPLLREDDDSPPERLLQAVWQHQRLIRDQLQTLDGQRLRILHPGFRSVEGGPDFRGAVVQFGDAPPQTGDVEIDIRASGWHAHAHDNNPAFAGVILHVIWEEQRVFQPGRPVCSLRSALDSSLGELSFWLGNESAKELPELFRGKCSGPLRLLNSDQLQDLLQQAAKVRFQSKAAQLQARARQAGWEQSLWEGLFRALGYKHNVWPMHRLAELRPRWLHARAELLALQARLFGISGLLPAELTRSQSSADHYLRQVWDRWWRERDEFADCILPGGMWRFHGIRPANHPHRRLALASGWALDPKLPGKLESWCASEVADRALTNTLLQTFQVDPGEFWAWHCTFRSARLKAAQPLLGATRVTDLAVNVVLPWLWARAVEGKNRPLQEKIEHRYFVWPPAEDNSLLRLARQRLLSGAPRQLLIGAAAQQGLIQIVRDFCEHSNAICDQCRFPELVQEFKTDERKKPEDALQEQAGAYAK